MADDPRVAIVPKGTVVHLNGEPCRLVEDTPVINASMALMGFEEYHRRTRVDDLRPVGTEHQPFG